MKDTEGFCAMKYVHVLPQEQYYFDLVDMASRYIHDTSRLCETGRFARRALYKLNTHRLLELYKRSPPLYRHALFIYDMNFEANYNPLKETLTRQTHYKSHISALHDILSRKWIQRVSETWDLTKHSGSELSILEQRASRKVVLGIMLPATSMSCFFKYNTPMIDDIINPYSEQKHYSSSLEATELNVPIVIH